MDSCAEVTFVEKPQIEIIKYSNYKLDYLIHAWSEKALKGTVVDQALPSLHRSCPLANYASSHFNVKP